MRTQPSISTRALRLMTARVTCHTPSTCATDAPTRNVPEGWPKPVSYTHLDVYKRQQLRFENILSNYVDLADVGQRLYAYESRNIACFGYGVKGMALSMIEAAIDITGASIRAVDIGRIVSLAKELLQHPVELLPGVRDAVQAVAADVPVCLLYTSRCV